MDGALVLPCPRERVVIGGAARVAAGPPWTGGITSLRSTVREGSVRLIFRHRFFLFLEFFLLFSKKNSNIFL